MTRTRDNTVRWMVGCFLFMVTWSVGAGLIASGCSRMEKAKMISQAYTPTVADRLSQELARQGCPEYTCFCMCSTDEQDGTGDGL